MVYQLKTNAKPQESDWTLEKSAFYFYEPPLLAAGVLVGGDEVAVGGATQHRGRVHCAAQAGVRRHLLQDLVAVHLGTECEGKLMTVP